MRVITRFVLERAQDEDIPRRIQLYQALAELALTPEERDLYLQLAGELHTVDALQRRLELLLDGDDDDRAGNGNGHSDNGGPKEPPPSEEV